MFAEYIKTYQSGKDKSTDEKQVIYPGIILCCLLRLNAQQSSVHTPHLVKNGNFTQLLVDNKPFLILGGELGNSSASSQEYMNPYG
jgi:hypothetical protein